MKITSQRFDFAKGTVKTREREIPDQPPVTPLFERLQRQVERMRRAQQEAKR